MDVWHISWTNQIVNMLIKEDSLLFKWSVISVIRKNKNVLSDLLNSIIIFWSQGANPNLCNYKDLKCKLYSNYLALIWTLIIFVKTDSLNSKYIFDHSFFSMGIENFLNCTDKSTRHISLVFLDYLF